MRTPNVRVRKWRGDWVIDWYDESGARRRRKIGDGSDEQEARRAARLKRRELEQIFNTECNPTTASVATVCDAWFEGNPRFGSIGFVNDSSKSDLTKSKYRTALVKIKRFFGGRLAAFSEMRSSDVEAYREHRLKVDGAAPKTVLNEMTLLLGVIDWAGDAGEDQRHYFLNAEVVASIKRNVEKPRLPKREPYAYSEEEIRRLLQAAHERDAVVYAALCLGYFNGLRTSSIARLRVEDVDLDKGTARVWQKNMRVEDDRQFRWLHENCVEALRRCPAVAGAVYWFGNEYAARPDQFSQRLCGFIRTVLPQVDRPMLFHAVRHAMAHSMVLAGKSEIEIANMLGHRSTATAAHYTRVWSHEVKPSLPKWEPVKK